MQPFQTTLKQSTAIPMLLALFLLSAAQASVAQMPMPTGTTPSSEQTTPEQSYLAANDVAMATMMSGMDAAPTGDVDRDFVAMMVPHHQGGIDMALAVLRYGKNEQLRRLAQEIIVTQQQEIIAMRIALGQPLPPSYPAPTRVPSDATIHQEPKR
jgi:uncharacterized protein (DUF305 family)